MKDGGSARSVETVVTVGSGFLLDRRSRSRRQNPIKRNDRTEDENQREVALLDFRYGRHRIAVGITRIRSAVLSAQRTAPERRHWNKRVSLNARSGGSWRHALHRPHPCRLRDSAKEARANFDRSRGSLLAIPADGGCTTLVTLGRRPPFIGGVLQGIGETLPPFARFAQKPGPAEGS